MNSEFLMTRNQQYAIFNWFLNKEITEFSIEIPWLSDSIIEVSLSEDSPTADIKILADEDTMDGVPGREEISSYNFRDTLVAAGIVKPGGWDDTISTLDDETNRNLYAGDRPCRIVFDTNAFLRRYFTLIHRTLYELKERTSLAGWGYVVTSGIREEMASYEKKYSHNVLNGYNGRYSESWFDFHQFFNQLMGVDRMFRMGSIECEKMIQTGRCLRVRSDRGDTNIIRALAEHSRNQGVDLIAVTEDSDFIAKCKSHEIQGHRLDIPQEIDTSYRIDWLNLSELLYVLALRFGAVRLLWHHSTSAQMLGIWLGKKEEPWKNENVLVRPDAATLSSWLKESLSIGYPSSST
ncbi:MAG: hypothetical protein GF309_08620 [Candidatus Lokiarchaeota archaeon]|nr:hypothetical protein [Candidatus Lokiarchaeota archaeon]